MDYFSLIRSLANTEKVILSGAAGAVIRDGRILLIQRRNLGQPWGVPGGVQELGETIQQTAHREVLEEAGLDMQPGGLIGVYSGPQWDITYPGGFAIQQVSLFFLMQGDIGEIQLQASEVADWGYFAPDSLPGNMLPCDRQKVLDWAAYRGQPVFR